MLHVGEKPDLHKCLNNCIFIFQMADKKDILKEINPGYFWDVNINNIDVSAAKQLIIGRVFSLGKLDEMIALIRYYGKREVVDTLRQINYLDPKTLNFVSKLFNKPKNSFKCYSRTPSTLRHWNS